MRAREARLWLDALVEMAGNDPFDREIASHIVRVLELVEGPGGRNLHSDNKGPSREMSVNTPRLLRARADAAQGAKTERLRTDGAYIEAVAATV